MSETMTVSASTPVVDTSPALLEITGLVKHFKINSGFLGTKKALVRAVDGVSFRVKAGETLGIVGESGCGKSTTARLLIGLIDHDDGKIAFDGQTMGETLSLAELRRAMQMVFQDSFSSLNPRLTIEDSIMFGPQVHGMATDTAKTLAHDLLRKVGLEPGRFAGRYPHELSGGQRQRVNIARALAFSPRIVILDEAVSALDKSVEAQVLNLLSDLKEELKLTYVFISHDLNVVRFISDRVMVMYLGEVVEIGPVESLYGSPQHPYTRALLAAMPSMDPDNRTMEAPLAGDPPNPINPPSGCRFHTRCAFRELVCSDTKPAMYTTGDSGHLAACHMLIPNSGHSQAPRSALNEAGFGPGVLAPVILQDATPAEMSA